MQPVKSTRLYLQCSATNQQEARPDKDALIKALAGCTRFRFFYYSTGEHIESVEFESLDKARKGFAILDKRQLPTQENQQVNCTVTLSQNPYDGSSSSASSDSDKLEGPSQEGRLLNVSELPDGFTVSELYDLFVTHGHIYSCSLGSSGIGKVHFYSATDAQKSQKALNFAKVENVQIIVRFPSRHDQKDTLKSPYTSTRFGKSERSGAIDDGVRTSNWCKPINNEESRAYPVLSAMLTGKTWNYGRIGHHHVISVPPLIQSRSVSSPLPIQDLKKIFISNLPDDLTEASKLLEILGTIHKQKHRLPEQNDPEVEPKESKDKSEVTCDGDCIEAVHLALDSATKQSQRFAIVTFREAAFAKTIIHELHGKALPGYEDSSFAGSQDGKADHVGETLVVRLFTPRDWFGCIRGVAATNGGASRSAWNVGAAAFTPSKWVNEPVRTPFASFTERPTATVKVQLSSMTQKRSKKLLALALEDYPDATEETLNSLLRLPEEEIKRCIIEEGFLRHQMQQLSKLDMAHATPAVAQVAPQVSPSTTALEDVPQRVLEENVDRSPSMTLDRLSRFSLKSALDLVESEEPPIMLAVRDKQIVEQVDKFLEEIKDLKPSQKKQKIGEKVFKMFKSKAPEMKSLSKRTVTLLDQEDLKALLHICEEFPDVLIARAMSLQL